jgi:EmrB/QacA subfamily drug resistance transporter
VEATADLARTGPDPRRWWALALLCSAYFMVILDVSIVNVALPSIQEDLHFSPDDLQWVLSAYALTFGGFLLLGGRVADVLGRRVVFMSGVALFTLASLACGLSGSEGMLIGARAVQGLGAAILSPAALSIITTTFDEGAERNKALGIWGAMGGSGAAVGVLLGGILTKALGWEWIFFVNVPVGAAVLLTTRSIVKESRAGSATRHFDALGAVLITSALSLLVFALTQANRVGWGSAQTIGILIASAALHVAFIAVEHRSQAPLVPLGIFTRLRTLTGANVVSFLVGGLTFAMFFMLSICSRFSGSRRSRPELGTSPSP